MWLLIPIIFNFLLKIELRAILFLEVKWIYIIYFVTFLLVFRDITRTIKFTSFIYRVDALLEKKQLFYNFIIVTKL